MPVRTAPMPAALMSTALEVTDEVRAALAAAQPVVALESTIISHGLPRPDNLRIGREIEAAVRGEGAVPATIAVVDGRVRIGLDDDALAAVAGRDDVVKAGVRDLAVVVARGGCGATTVASTAHLATLAGIAVFATGGLGGVHRDAATSFDESADLVTLSRVPVTVVCAGVKSILDVAATLERMETLGIGLLGYGTHAFPGFYLTDSGHPVEHRVDSPAEVAAVMRARAALGTDRSALVVANPLPPHEQLDPELHDQVLQSALKDAVTQGIHGKAATPFLLARFHHDTGGKSLEVNTTIIVRNAALAARIAVAAAEGR